MYNEETKTFSFPYDQKRLNALKYIVTSERRTHNDIVYTRNNYRNKHIKKINTNSSYYFKEGNILDYWDKKLDKARRNAVVDAYILLCNSELIPKDDNDD